MSDTPSETPDVSGGWHTPSTPGAWRAPKEPKETVGWRVPALPAELKQAPEHTGDWHTPSPADTPFTEEDELEIAQRPEDIVDQTGLTTSTQPEEEALAPEDLMFLIEQEDDDEFDALGMSELVALASLVDEGEPAAEIVTGVESPIPVSLALEPDAEEVEDEFATEMLSPAERVMLETPEISVAADEPSDAADYARQQLAMLGGADITTQETVPGEPLAPVEGESDAADYARQQMAMLSGDAPPATAPMSDTAMAEATTPLTPRQQELARQFHQTEEQVRALRSQVQMGTLPHDVFLAQLRELMVLDDDQVWWMMGVETDTWYKAENNTWVEAVPDVLQAERSVVSPSGPSLPYLAETVHPTEASEYSEFTPSGADVRVDENFMPLPREVPIHDPDYTVPSAGVFDRMESEPDPYGAATVPSESSYAQPTVMAEPVSYGTIESPFDESDPPDYEAYDLDEEGTEYDIARQQQRMSTQRILVFAGIAGLILIFAVGALFIGAAMLWYNGVVDEWEAQIAALENYQPTFQTLTLLDTRGNTIATLGREGDDRRPVDLEQISPYMIHASISLENEGFYEDPGWDMVAIVRAFWQNFTAGEIESGASTITQQVARNLVLQSTEVTADRKLNEVIVAGELSRRYDKNFILELYLNEVAFFGNSSYGVEAAAQFYFQKPAAELTLPESAMLSAIIQSPANNEPVNNRETALHLMRVAMDRMADVGCLNFQHTPPFGEQRFCVDQALIDSPDTVIALAEVETGNFRAREFSVLYPHFTQLVQNQLEALFGPNEIYSGGYVVTTTLDSTLQEHAQRELTNHVAQNSTNGVNAGSVMVTDPRNGAVLALVGSPDFSNTEAAGEIDFNRTWQQPGSAIKPILFSAALQGVDHNGNDAIEPGEYLTPASILWDVDTLYANGYRPTNYDRRYHGPTPLRYALQNSYNVTAIKAFELVGEAQFKAVAENMGLQFIEGAEFNITTAIGSTDVRVYDMMEAFGTIANNGMRMDLYLIESIVDAGGNPVDVSARGEPVQALSPQVAYLMQSILSDDPARAEQFGQNSALTISGVPTQNYVAAKTGTSNDGRDLWTMGFTNNRVVGVWLGTHDNEPTFNTLGSRTAAPLWNRVMDAALQGEGNGASEFVPPPGIIARQICVDTGSLPSDICGNIRNEFFVDSMPPPPADQSFGQTLSIDSWTGLLQNEFCPENVVQENFVTITDPYAVQWLNTVGQDYAMRVDIETPVQTAPTAYCDQNTPIPVVRISSPGGGQTVQGQYAITGQVSAQGFDRYQLEFASVADPENFTIFEGPIATQHTNANSMLGTWDTTQLFNGDYILRLAVFSVDGGYLYRTALVQVNNPLATPTPNIPPTTDPSSLPSPIPFDAVDTPVPAGLPTPTIDPLG